MNCRRETSRPHGRQRPVALSSSILKRVPVEILVSIMSYLPLESAVAFPLSCLHLKHVLGTEHFIKLASSSQELLALLYLLACDLPNHVICSPCRKLHDIKNLGRYITTEDTGHVPIYEQDVILPPACVVEDEIIQTFMVTQMFGSTAFRMAIKRYHQQPECTRLLNMMSSTDTTTTIRGNYIHQYKEKCRIVNGCLMHRLQSVWVLRKPSDLPFTRNLPPEIICPHIRLKSRSYVFGSRVKKCEECCTDYCVDFSFYPSLRWVMFFTRWKNLGTGPDGEIWRQHYVLQATELQDLPTWVVPSKVRIQNSVEIPNQGEVGSEDSELSFAFGDGKYLKFDSLLTPENETELYYLQENNTEQK